MFEHSPRPKQMKSPNCTKRWTTRTSWCSCLSVYIQCHLHPVCSSDVFWYPRLQSPQLVSSVGLSSAIATWCIPWYECKQRSGKHSTWLAWELYLRSTMACLWFSLRFSSSAMLSAASWCLQIERSWPTWHQPRFRLEQMETLTWSRQGRSLWRRNASQSTLARGFLLHCLARRRKRQIEGKYPSKRLYRWGHQW